MIFETIDKVEARSWILGQNGQKYENTNVLALHSKNGKYPLLDIIYPFMHVLALQIPKQINPIGERSNKAPPFTSFNNHYDIQLYGLST